MRKQYAAIAASTLLVMSGCGTYAGQGAYTGATFGSILGSAIGGISDGPRGHDMGTIVGMAGGAVLGGIIGNAADQQRQQGYDNGGYASRRQRQRDYDDDIYTSRQRRQRPRAQQPVTTQQSEAGYGSGFDENNGGDDRIEFTPGDGGNSEKGTKPTQVLPGSSSVENIAEGITYTPTIEIRNARFIDANGDNRISRNELCKVVFEVYNNGRQTIYDVQPMVVEATGNRHIFISPGVHVEKIAPGCGIRYTALVKADNRIKAGNVKLCISVIEGNNHKISKVNEFNIATCK